MHDAIKVWENQKVRHLGKRNKGALVVRRKVKGERSQSHNDREMEGGHQGGGARVAT
jgi:hypothetical protein